MASKIHRASVSLMAAGAVAVLAACGSSTPSSSSSPPTPTPSSTTSMSANPSATASASTSPIVAHPGVPMCTSNIRVINGQSQGAAGHLTLVLIFNNVGRTPCRILGYPGVALVSKTGATIANAKRTLSGMAGGATAVTTITLAAGHSASALLEASDVPQGSITNCGSYALKVTPPGEYVAVTPGTAMMPRCELEIHPVVAGTGGGMR